ncbi:MAG: phosphotransferase [Anaerolineaceae bacterium]|nr:phosphotransferase [Anaerolineaceae bacterium]
MQEQPPLSPFQENLVLSVFPSGAQIISAQYFRDKGVPCPMKVQVALSDGGKTTVVLRITRPEAPPSAEGPGVTLETELLPLLAECGLPVPRVLAGPVFDPNQPMLDAMTVLSLLPGENLLTLGEKASPQERQVLEPILISAVSQIQSVTQVIIDMPLAATFPCDPLQRIWQMATANETWWRHEPQLAETVQEITPRVQQVETPLAFSNMDFHPSNFLSDGRRLTGLVDFVTGCFEDPLYGIAEYPAFSLTWLPYDGLSIAERYADEHGFTKSELYVRIAVAIVLQLSYRMRPNSEAPVQIKQALLSLLQKAMYQL